MSKPTKYSYGLKYKLKTINRELKKDKKAVKKLRRRLNSLTKKAAAGQINLNTIVRKLGI